MPFRTTLPGGRILQRRRGKRLLRQSMVEGGRQASRGHPAPQARLQNGTGIATAHATEFVPSRCFERIFPYSRKRREQMWPPRASSTPRNTPNSSFLGVLGALGGEDLPVRPRAKGARFVAGGVCRVGRPYS